jgi:hypothetical protein
MIEEVSAPRGSFTLRSGSEGVETAWRSPDRPVHDGWHFLTNRLAIVVADHHHYLFRLFRRDDIAHHLRPIALAALDKAGIGATYRHLTSTAAA